MVSAATISVCGERRRDNFRLGAGNRHRQPDRADLAPAVGIAPIHNHITELRVGLFVLQVIPKPATETAGTELVEDWDAWLVRCLVRQKEIRYSPRGRQQVQT